jgi:hypothetical protein
MKGCSFSSNPGSHTQKFAAGEFQVPFALIIGTRKPSTDLKTSLNNALREYDVKQFNLFCSKI